MAEGVNQLLWFIIYWMFHVGNGLPQTIRLGALLDESYSPTRLNLITDAINLDTRILPKSRLILESPQQTSNNSFHNEIALCQLLHVGVAGIVVSSEVDTGGYVKSLCTKYDIPYIEINQPTESQAKDKRSAIHFFPTAETMSKTCCDLMKKLKWKRYVILYDSPQNLFGFRNVFENENSSDSGSTPILRQLPETKNYIEFLQKIQEIGASNVLIIANTFETEVILTQAQELGMMTQEYSYIVTTLDFHLLPISKFQYSGASIRGFRLVDTNSPEVRKVFSDHNAFRNSELGKFTNTAVPVNKLKISTSVVVLYDALKTFAKTLHILDSTQQINIRSLNCNKAETWGFGSTILNYIKMLPTHGLTGKIDFDNTPFRTNILLEVVQLKQNGIQKIGSWNTTASPRLNLLQLSTSKDNSKFTTNEPLVVRSVLSRPFLMLKAVQENPEDKFHGFLVDLLTKLSQILKFGFTLEVIESKESNEENKDNLWDAVIEEVFEQKADFAIGDLTTTSERLKKVEFVPFMHFGLTVVTAIPNNTNRNWFSVLRPFSTTVWIGIVGAYLAVSILYYVVTEFPKSGEKRKCGKNRSQNRGQSTRNQNVFNGLFCMIWSNRLHIGSHSAKMLALSWSTFLILIVSTYTANSVSFFLNKGQGLEGADVQDLFDGGVQFVCVRNSTTMKYLQLSTSELEKNIWKQIEANPKSCLKSSIDGAIAEVLHAQGRIAFLGESPTIEYSVKGACGLKIVGNPFNSFSYGMGVHRESKWLEPLRAAMIKIQEDAFLSDLKQKWWNTEENLAICKEAQTQVQPVTGPEVFALFLFLAISSLVAIPISLCSRISKWLTSTSRSQRQDLVKDVEFVQKGQRDGSEAVFTNESLTPYLDLGINAYGFPSCGSSVDVATIQLT